MNDLTLLALTAVPFAVAIVVLLALAWRHERRHRSKIEAVGGLVLERSGAYVLPRRSAPAPIHDQVRRDRCPHDHVITEATICSTEVNHVCTDCDRQWILPRATTQPAWSDHDGWEVNP